MGQTEVYDFLKKNRGKWFTAADINKKLKLSKGSVTTALFKLKKWDLIRHRKLKNKRTTEYSA